MEFFESIFYMAWRGIAIGLIISAPMGPVGMLCIQRTLDKGRRAGFYTGIGAALSDLFYSLLTGFGLSFIEEFLERNSNIIQLAGSAVLIAFGIYLFRKNPARTLRKPLKDEVSIKKNILGGFLFTFSNPLILFLIIGLFARFNFLLPEFKVYQYFTGFVFIFVGAIIWWWFITFSIDKVRHHFNIRSMWLINRIIGVIIMLFAVVGIITATSALVKGADMQCWNAGRGFGPFQGEGNILKADADTLRLLTDAGGADALEFRLRMRNLTPGKPWGLLLYGSGGEEAAVDFRTVEGAGDGVTTAPALQTTLRCDGRRIARTHHADSTGMVKKLKDGYRGPDPTGRLNFYKVCVAEGTLSLFGGLHTPVVLLQERLPEGFRADSIGVYLCPGTRLQPEELRLSTTRFHSDEVPLWSDGELLDEYLEGSSDPMEGYYAVLDRSMEESLLRMGGDYRLAIVRAEDGYDLVYLSGARVNAGAWSPGMVKAHLSPSGIGGVWNVNWSDAMHRSLFHDIKAQLSAESGLLNISFPYQSSSLRLIRISH